MTWRQTVPGATLTARQTETDHAHHLFTNAAMTADEIDHPTEDRHAPAHLVATTAISETSSAADRHSLQATRLRRREDLETVVHRPDSHTRTDRVSKARCRNLRRLK